MELHLPAESIDHFDEQALSFCSKLRKRIAPPKGEAVTGLSSEAHAPTRTIDQKDVLDIHIDGTRDGLGRRLSRCFKTLDGYLELSGEDYQAFRRLAQQVHGAGSLADSLSEEFVESVLFDWLERRHKGQISAQAGYIGHLKLAALDAVRRRRMGIPLDSISIEAPFEVGAVSFDYFKRGFFDSFEVFLLSQKKNDPNRIQQAISRFRERYQGRVYASVEVEAETERAIELAKQKVDESLMLLRFFSPAALLPEIPCYFDVLGRASVPTVDIFDFASATPYPSIIQRIEEKRQFTLHVGSEELDAMKKQGLDVAAALVSKPSRTELEELLLTCISLVARATKAAEFHEKIVFTLAAAETLLLANAAEPIQQSLGLRLAFLTSDDLNSRRTVLALVKDTYRCRSAYLHHGRQIGDLETAKELQITVWTALHNALLNLGKVRTQSELLQLIENMLLS